jgi:hypothetical protein
MSQPWLGSWVSGVSSCISGAIRPGRPSPVAAAQVPVYDPEEKQMRQKIEELEGMVGRQAAEGPPEGPS